MQFSTRTNREEYTIFVSFLELFSSSDYFRLCITADIPGMLAYKRFILFGGPLYVMFS